MYLIISKLCMEVQTNSGINEEVVITPKHDANLVWVIDSPFCTSDLFPVIFPEMSSTRGPRNLSCHYVRPSFTVSRLSRRNFSWPIHYSKSLPGCWMVFPAGGATMNDSFEHVDKGDNSRWLAYPSIMLGNSLLRVIFDKIPSCECEDSPKWWLHS